MNLQEYRTDEEKQEFFLHSIANNVECFKELIEPFLKLPGEFLFRGVKDRTFKMFSSIRRTRQTLWSAVQMLTQKLCCQTIHDCPKVVPLHYESE